jgi:hypothetical protein
MSDGVEHEHIAPQDGGTHAVVTKKLMRDRRACEVANPCSRRLRRRLPPASTSQGEELLHCLALGRRQWLLERLVEPSGDCQVRRRWR